MWIAKNLQGTRKKKTSFCSLTTSYQRNKITILKYYTMEVLIVLIGTMIVFISHVMLSGNLINETKN